MKARPILFSGPMIRVLLDGSKTQTRRLVKSHPLIDGGNFTDGFVRLPENHVIDDCPYGKPGDLLWVRETTRNRMLRVIYAADDATALDPIGRECGWNYSRNVCPGIHMPRALSRLTLRVTDVRVERLQEISEADAVAEGTFPGAVYPPAGMTDHQVLAWKPDQSAAGVSAKNGYRSLWESINGPGSWDANPWVWVISFECIKANVDGVMAEKKAA